MQKDLVFFKKEGEEGVALTSTSANHIANMAKEYIQGIEAQLNNISFLNIQVGLIGADTSNVIQECTPKDIINKVPEMLEDVARAKSLIAWLREGIKAKNHLIHKLQAIKIEDWCNENGIELPSSPTAPHILTEEEYYASLSVKERNRYYQLEAYTAVVGKYIHPDGVLSNKRKELNDKIYHPHKVDGIGRDSLVYTYKPSVDTVEVDGLFYELQKDYREVQAQLNSMKHGCELAIQESTNKSSTEYITALNEYKARMKEITASFIMWKNTESQRYSNLKITIPNSLLNVYSTINSLGK